MIILAIQKEGYIVNVEDHVKIDKLGLSLSGLCAIHCLLTPLFLLFLPAWGTFFKHEAVHLIFFLFVVPLALLSFVGVYKKHGDKTPLILGSIGSLMLLISLVEHGHQEGIHLVSLFGSGFLVAGHLKSLRCKCTSHCH